MRSALGLVLLVACSSPSAPVAVDPDEATSGPGGGKADSTAIAVPDVRCDALPDAGPTTSYRHLSSRLIAALGSPRHRGLDLVVGASADTQRIEGWISYTVADKALEDEDVDLFACRSGTWRSLGHARTDHEGHYSLDLADADRLPIAMRDLYVSVRGDRSGVRSLAYVAPDDAPLIASDVDGTLTSSEQAFVKTMVLGIEPDAQPGAATAYQAAADKGYQLVYVTARGNQYTTATRDWLEHEGFPRGPLRLSPSFVTLPGGDTIAYKQRTLQALTAELPVVMGVGNRASDVTAYAAVGIDAGAITLKLPEYATELKAALDSGAAVGVESYDELRTTLIAALPAR